jgi:hypothetical protein
MRPLCRRSRKNFRKGTSSWMPGSSPGMTAILLRGTQTSKSPAVSRRGFAIREIATPRSGIEIAVHAKAELPIVGVGNVGHTGRRPITQARTLCHGYVVFHPPVGGFCRVLRANVSEFAADRMVACECVVLVGAAGFEPATFWSQTRRATRLRYAPKAISGP